MKLSLPVRSGGGGTIIDRFFKIGKSVTFVQIDHFRFGVCWCPKIRIDGNIVRYQKAKRTWRKGKDEDEIEEENTLQTVG